MLILERNATACKLGFELTDVQLGCLVAKMLRDFEKENSVGKLEPGREDVGEEATEGHDPTPATVWRGRKFDQGHDDIFVVERFSFIAMRVDNAAEPGQGKLGGYLVVGLGQLLF